MKRPRTYRETLNANDRAQQAWANAHGVPVDQRYLNNLPDAKPRKPSERPEDLEAAVAQEIEKMLAGHPLVAFAVRQNSGRAEYGEGATERTVRYWRWAKKPRQTEQGIITIVDYWGLLNDGRMWAVEAKHRLWKMTPSDYHAEMQARFLAAVRRSGGLAGFATSADEARKIIEGAARA